MPLLPPKIFISYSHDSEEHSAAVLMLANRLRHDGLDCAIDQYINGFPPEGWQRWMETHIEQADFVLMVCTPLYLKRYRGLDNNGGRGVTFEGGVISQSLYDVYYLNTKFVPILPDGSEVDHIPLPLKSFGAFQIDKEYEGLYRYLTGQAAVVAPDIGEKVEIKQSHSNSSSNKMNTKSSLELGQKSDAAKIDEISMINPMKAAWISGVLVLLGALIVGLYALWTVPRNTTKGDFSPIINGNHNQVTATGQPETVKKQ